MWRVRACIALLVVLGVAAGVTAASAQAPVPTVTVTANATAVSVSPNQIAPGATRFELVSGEKKAELTVFLAAVKPGRTLQEVTAAVASNDEDAALEMVDIVASAGLSPGGRRAFTVDIKANTQYFLLDDAGEKTPDVVTPITVAGAPTGAKAAKPAAEVQLRDLRFGGNGTLPRRGTVRVSNVGWAPHFALAAPLRSGARRSTVGRAIRGGSERALGRVLDFRNAVELSSVVTRNAVADQEVRFNRRGRYVLVCFFEGHNAQGMYRFVTVK